MDVLGIDANKYYGKEEALKYEKGSGMKKVQFEITSRAIELLGLKTGKVLDVGCGTGFSLEILKENRFEVTGVDVAEEMVKIAKSKGFEVKLGSMLDLDYSDEYFEGLISISAMQWINGNNVDEVIENYKKVASEMFRVLKNTGRGVIQFYPQSKGEFELWVKCFKFAGFKVETTVDEGASHQKGNKKFILLEK